MIGFPLVTADSDEIMEIKEGDNKIVELEELDDTN
jgi:hypothetical protein